MTDEVEVPEAESETVETPVKEKTFTQAEVNRLIGKERQTLTAKHQSELELKDASLMKFEGIIKADIEAKVKDLPESIQKILAKLPLIEQYEALMNDDELKVSKKTIPSTLKSEEKPKPEEELRTSAFQRFKK